MQKKEAQFRTEWLATIGRTLIPPMAIEFKHTRGKATFTLRELKKHQHDWLKAIEAGKGVPYTISDSAIGYKPCDSILFGNIPAYVVIKYPKHWYMIPIRRMPLSGNLTEKEAEQICSITNKKRI